MLVRNQVALKNTVNVFKPIFSVVRTANAVIVGIIVVLQVQEEYYLIVLISFKLLYLNVAKQIL